MIVEEENLPTTEEEYEVTLVVPIQGTTPSMFLLTRLIKTLKESDFPKRYLTIVTIGEGYQSRRKGAEAALQAKSKWILQSDNDCYVPREFWKKMVDLAESDPKIGSVQVVVGFDGFCLFRPAFLRETGIRDGSYDAEEILKRSGWRTVACEMSLGHDKGAPLTRIFGGGKEGVVMESHSRENGDVILKLRGYGDKPIELVMCYIGTQNYGWELIWNRIRFPTVIFPGETHEVTVPPCSGVRFVSSRNNTFQFSLS
jgi:hypothetical protein